MGNKMTIKIRETFGVVNPLTSKQYTDIILASIEARLITEIKLLPNSVLFYRDEAYLIHCDSKLKRKLREEGLVRVIVSFQKRTYGNYAECRIFTEKE